MAKIIKNKDSVEHTWVGQTILAGDSYTIQPEQMLSWVNNSTLLSAIISGIAVVNNGTSDITDVNLAISFLKDIVAPVDTDGSPLSRLKLAPAGWTFQDHCLEMTTSTLNSVYSKKSDGTDYNFTTLKFYELVSNVETLITGDNLTQEYLDIHCVKTVVEWEPTHDYDVIKGEIAALSSVPNDTRLWIVAVPDIPYAYGGSKELATGGMNLQHHASYEFDGRVVKHLTYNATYHTNKIQVILRHSAGDKVNIEICVDFYKA